MLFGVICLETTRRVGRGRNGNQRRGIYTAGSSRRGGVCAKECIQSGTNGDSSDASIIWG